MPIQLFLLNTGSCGACDAELVAAVARSSQLAWVASPHAADVLVLTGPITAGTRPALRAMLAELNGQVPLVAIGRCAIDGHPYGRGGLAELPDIQVRLKLDGCPPAPAAMVDALLAALSPMVRQ